jgi:hypothetical protein
VSPTADLDAVTKKNKRTSKTTVEGVMQFSAHRRVYAKVPGLAGWSENCKWYNSLILGAVV